MSDNSVIDAKDLLMRVSGDLIPAACFDPGALSRLADSLAGAYAAAQPFPHAVIDHFFPRDLAQSVLDEFPSPGAIDWIRYDAPKERKLQSRYLAQLGAVTRHVLAQFNSAMFVEFLERLTGHEALLPDPHFYGGGLHQIEPGGYLKIHSDFNFHPSLRLYRKINVLLYLNPDWQESYGGHLELWNDDMTRCGQRILPRFNRCVIFSTSERSFHGHPDPLASPLDLTRKSLAAYFYSSWRGHGEPPKIFGTLWQSRIAVGNTSG